MNATGQNGRSHDLDWIKVLVMLIVFLYHVSMFFNSYPWHIKNIDINKTYIEVFSLLAGNWMMPVFFVISGIGTFHALRKRNAQGFIKERLLRLGLPLLVGVFVLSPPQVYVERAVNRQFEGSFLSFFPRYFDGLYLEIGGTGNFAFFGHHLWYLLMLLIFSCVTLPFFLKRKQNISEKPFHFLHFSICLYL
ncbi:acyltransferase family protein [Paenibacillus sp.]|uniref:acyltransferase family protein n=1 Tax=Paenibacillus sp. TaxID=58172 RepID=UPI002D7374D9|nr:acyltransferase family protein [Paenibacillus sp.]HZG84075.1 acyltransferase family protein [Paenibacillus sp.]